MSYEPCNCYSVESSLYPGCTECGQEWTEENNLVVVHWLDLSKPCTVSDCREYRNSREGLAVYHKQPCIDCFLKFWDIQSLNTTTGALVCIKKLKPGRNAKSARNTIN